MNINEKALEAVKNLIRSQKLILENLANGENGLSAYGRGYKDGLDAVASQISLIEELYGGSGGSHE